MRKRILDSERRKQGIRPARVLLEELGDPDCPPDKFPAPDLVRECRLALRMNRKALSWKLGAPSRNGYLVGSAELGDRPLPRYARIILRHLLEELKLEQERNEIRFDPSGPWY